MKFQPRDVASPATCAAFQADSTFSYSLFVVGFQDGTLSLFKTAKLARRSSQLDGSINLARALTLQPTRLGSVKKLHKAVMDGITAVEFLPEYVARVVSIGNDGRCRLVDLEGGGRVLRT
jgi:hypothetical protein